jgi:hypothetical protein
MRRTREEMFAMNESWECSQEPQSHFCKRHEVTLATFGYWRTKYLKDKNITRPALGSFIGLHPQLPEGLEIVYPNGVRIRMPQSSPLTDVQALIHLS